MKRSPKFLCALRASACLLALLVHEAAAAPDVGVATAVNPAAEGGPPGGGRRQLSLGDNIIHNERIVTGEAGLVQLLLVDGTSFTIGANADLTIDRFVYDPEADTAEVAATLAKGVLRFIGGRASKTGGATIGTALGVIGIRGGMGILDSEAKVFHCIYGTCQVGGVEMQAGETAFSEGGSIQVRPTSAEDMKAVQAKLESSGDGGSKVSNDDVNAGAEGGNVASADDPNAGDLGLGLISSDPTNSEDIEQDLTSSDPTPVPTPEPEPEPEPETTTLRLLTADATYTTLWGQVLEDAGEKGLVGGSPDHDRTMQLTLTPTEDPSSFAGTGTDPLLGNVTIPFFRGGANLADEPVSVLSTLGTFSGRAYSRAGFNAFMLTGLVGGEVEPFYALTGDLLTLGPDNQPLPGSFPEIFAGDNVRQYSLTADPIQNVAVPFLRNGLIDLDGVESTNLYVIESPAPEEQFVRMMQGWLQITGTGSAQQSGIGVTAGDFLPLGDGEFGFRSGRHGSVRSNSDASASLFYGALNTVAGPDGQEVFGVDGSNFLLSTDIAGNDAFGDGSADGFEHFNTVHVANLVGEAPASAPQSSRTLRGFSAAMVEDFSPSEAFPRTLAPLLSSGASGIELEFDAGSNTLAGELRVNDFFDRSSNVSFLQVAVGYGLDDGSGGSSVFIDDNLFAAGTNGGGSNFENTFALTDSDEQLIYADNEFPVTYFISGDALSLGDAAFMEGASLCLAQCSFAEWGWWGGQPRLAAALAPGEEILTQSIHLGTWVAGDINTWTEFDSQVDPSGASYQGHAIGSVSISSDALTQYIAGGAITFNWNPEQEVGLLSLVNFDGATYGGILTRQDLESEDALLTGLLFGGAEANELYGVANATFVADGANALAGIIGDFGLNRGGYQAAGTFIGAFDGEAEAVVAAPFRILTAGDEYVLPFVTVENPGQYGLVGGSANNDQHAVLNLTFGDEGLQASGTISQDGESGTVQVPLTLAGFMGGESGSEPINGGISLLGDEELVGTVFYGPGNFSAHILAIAGDTTRPLYAITGVPTDVRTVFGGADVRRYSFSSDPLQGIPVPFMLAEEMPGLNYAAAAITDAYIVEPETLQEEGPNPRFFQAWLRIEGVGPDQRSAIGVTATGVGQIDGDYVVDLGRRGSYRSDDVSTSYQMFGGVATVAGPVDGDHFFGPNAENFILSAGTDQSPGYLANDSFGSIPASADGGPPPFSTLHVFTLQEETPIESHLLTNETTRSSRNLNGFAAGMIEGRNFDNEGASSPVGFFNADPNSVRMNFRPGGNTVGGEILVRDHFAANPDIDFLQVAFGAGIGDNSENGGSAYIDDDLFGARPNPALDRTFVGNDPIEEGGSPQIWTRIPENNAGTYLVSSDAVPQSDFMPEGAEFCSSCDFLEWGWWGTQVRVAQGENPTEETLRTGVHLGTWVAGEVSTHDQIDAHLEQLAPGVDQQATYRGHVVGSVNNAGSQYVAGGSLEMTWRFAEREGFIAINDFDNHDYGGSLAAGGSPDAFMGELVPFDDSGITGHANGAFVSNGSDPGAGAIGNFGLTGDNYSASGTFAGAHDGYQDALDF